MTLLDSKINHDYLIDDIEVEGNTGRRMKAIGRSHGTGIEVIDKKRNGAIGFKARGTRVAVGKDMASKIIIATKEA